MNWIAISSRVATVDWAKVSDQLLNSDNQGVQFQATALGVTFGDAAAMSLMRVQVTDSTNADESRLIALQSLLGANDLRLVPTLKSLLDASSSLKEAAIQGLAQYSDSSIAPSLIATYPKCTPRQKRMVMGTLCGRSRTVNWLSRPTA